MPIVEIEQAQLDEASEEIKTLRELVKEQDILLQDLVELKDNWKSLYYRGKKLYKA